MERKIVPLTFADKIIGEAEVEFDEKGFKIIMTNITDPTILAWLEEPTLSGYSIQLDKKE